MPPDYDWDDARYARRSLFGLAGSSVLRFTLLFGSVAVALALIAVPMAEDYARPMPSTAVLEGLDMMTTASTGKRGTYTIRRSVLQATPASYCIIQSGDSRGRKSC